MIYLTKSATTQIIGAFDTIALAKQHLESEGITDFSDYFYLRRIEDMSYISRICYIDSVCIYNNKNFWLNIAQSIKENYSSHIVSDFFGKSVDISRFIIELNQNAQRLSNIYTTADEVAYNMQIGSEFISLFREECILTDMGGQSGLGIAASVSNVIPLILTGAFKEANTLISMIPLDDFFTSERIAKYKDCILASDVIVYLS